MNRMEGGQDQGSIETEETCFRRGSSVCSKSSVVSWDG